MTNSSIVKEGRLTVPLFHGTSSLFYDSIRSTGLGGRNIVEDMGIRKAARLLLELGTGLFQEEDDVSACMQIAADPDKHRLGTLRYGGTYVSASSETAANYALLYTGGGEALTHILRLHRRLSAIKPDLAARQEFTHLIEFVARPATPILVEAHSVEIDGLRSDCGRGIEVNLARMESWIGDDYYDGIVAQHNFELIQPIPPNQLRFHRIQKVQEFDGEGGTREIFQFTPFDTD